MTPAIHLLHKPAGPTSFSVVKDCHDSLRGRKPPRLCHGGTLDPFASGLLLILVEPATKLFDFLHDIPKTYEATVRWGIETDNGDPHGAVSCTGDATSLSVSQLEGALASCTGWHDQVAHATSARRIDGERAYEKAHRGERVVMPAVPAYLHEASWLSHDLPRESRLRLTVRGGYYVRALARDLGRMLGCGAHLSQLHRTAIGPWTDPGLGQTQIVSGEDVMPWLPVRELNDAQVNDLRQGRAIACDSLRDGAWALPKDFPSPRDLVRGFHRDRFVFLLERAGEKLTRLAQLRGGL